MVKKMVNIHSVVAIDEERLFTNKSLFDRNKRSAYTAPKKVEKPIIIIIIIMSCYFSFVYREWLIV